MRLHRYYVIKMSVNGASTTFCLASRTIRGQCGDSKTQSKYQPSFLAKMLLTTSSLCPKNVRQRSVNDFWPCIMDNPRAVQRHEAIITLSAAFLGKNGCNYITTMSYKSASMERERLLAMHPRQSEGSAAISTHYRTIGRLFIQKCY